MRPIAAEMVPISSQMARKEHGYMLDVEYVDEFLFRIQIL
jgi:hypothetical protein